LTFSNCSFPVFYYSTSVFEEIIDEPLVGTTCIGAVNVVFTYVALLLMDTCERKSLVLWSTGGMFVSCATLICCQTAALSWRDNDQEGSSYGNGGGGMTALLAVNAYVAFYAIGMGPIPSLFITEMVPPRYVSLTMSLCSQLNWLVNFFVGLAFPLMREQLQQWSFVPFAVVLLASYLFAWAALPERKAVPMHLIGDRPGILRWE
jgi:MFS family permease